MKALIIINIIATLVAVGIAVSALQTSRSLKTEFKDTTTATAIVFTYLSNIKEFQNYTNSYLQAVASSTEK